MKYLERPFPSTHFLAKIPVGNDQWVEIAFDTKEEVDKYTRSIPESSFPGVLVFFVTDDEEIALKVVECKSFCTLVYRCDDISEKIKH